MPEKETCCCLTGHRDIPPTAYESVAAAFAAALERLYREGITTFYCGGALGFDTIAAVTLINKRPRFPGLRLVMVLPCPEQSDRWPAPSRALYRSILQKADEVITLSPVYTRDCMFERNRYMVEHSAVCLAYLRRRQGGSAYTVRYAEQKGLRILNLAGTFAEEQEGHRGLFSDNRS